MTEFDILTFFNGAIMMACLVAGLFFLRFYRDTKDRFFGLFSLAFVILAIDRFATASLGNINDVEPTVYIIRCAAFLVIIGAVIDKNRKG